jgi:hypothetical protein
MTKRKYHPVVGGGNLPNLRDARLSSDKSDLALAWKRLALLDHYCRCDQCKARHDSGLEPKPWLFGALNRRDR